MHKGGAVHKGDAVYKVVCCAQEGDAVHKGGAVQKGDAMHNEGILSIWDELINSARM